MDVSRSEAQRAETNVIARSVDRATTIESESASHRREIKKSANGPSQIHWRLFLYINPIGRINHIRKLSCCGSFKH
jgi:hypothetical protein